MADVSTTEPSSGDAPLVPSVPPPPKRTWPRMVLLGVLLVGGYIVGVQTGATEYLTVDRIREFMLGLGVWGFLLYLAVFCVGELMHIPGMVFMVAAVIAYGPLWGGLAAFFGGLLSVSFTFVLVRTVGGQPLGEVKWNFMRRVLSHLDTRPILVVAVLRLAFTLSPVLNYALAMSPLRFREYFVGSVLGFAPWAVGVAFLADWILTLI